MARWRFALTKSAWRFACVAAFVFTALGTSGAMAQTGQGKQSFPERYKDATGSVGSLIWDIDEYAGCRDLGFVADDVSASKRTLNELIAEAKRTGQDIAAQDLEAWRDDLLDTFADYKAYCVSHLLYFRVRPVIEAGVVSQDVTGHVQRLAHDVGGNIRYDFGNVDQKSSGGAFQVAIDVPLYRVGKYSYFLDASYGFSKLTSSASGGANGPFNMPGLGVGNFPNGLSTAANTPVSYQYDSDSSRHDIDLSAGMRFRSGYVYFSPSIGGNFGINTVDDSYTFDRPALPTITGKYTTNSTAYKVGGYLQMGVDYRIPDSNVTIFGVGKAGVDYNWARSDVSFQVTSVLSDDQKVSISDTKVTPNLSLEGGVKVDLGAWEASLKGGVQYGRYMPNVSIPGGGSRPLLKGETATEYSVMAAVKMDLSGLGKAQRRTDHRQKIYFSDMRLKRDIAQVGRLANGLKLYRYRYLWSDTVYVGVMAQEVALLEPKAVMHGPDGFLRVDYGRLGLRMMTWDEWLAHGGCAKPPAANSNCRMENTAG